MRKSKTMYLGIIAAVCLCICSVIVLTTIRKPGVGIGIVDGNMTFYATPVFDGGYSAERISIPTTTIDAYTSTAVVRIKGSNLEVAEVFFNWNRGGNISTIDVPKSDGATQYYVCVSNEIHYDNTYGVVNHDRFKSELQKALDSTDDRGDKLNLNVLGKNLEFRKITIKYLDDVPAIEYTGMTVDGEDYTTAGFITDSVEIAFNVRSKNAIDEDHFKSGKKPSSVNEHEQVFNDINILKCDNDPILGYECGTFSYKGFTYDGDDRDSYHKYTVKYTFTPAQNARCSDVAITSFISDSCNVNFSPIEKKDGEVKILGRAIIINNKKATINVGSAEVKGEFAQDDSYYKPTKEPSKTFRVNFTCDDPTVFDAVTTDSQITIQDNPFNDPQTVKMIKDETGVHADVTISCKENNCASEKLRVNLNYKIGVSTYDIVAVTTEKVNMDRKAPTISDFRCDVTDDWVNGKLVCRYNLTDLNKIGETYIECNGVTFNGTIEKEYEVNVEGHNETRYECYAEIDVSKFEAPVIADELSVEVTAADELGNAAEPEKHDLGVKVDREEPTIKITKATLYRKDLDGKPAQNEKTVSLKDAWNSQSIVLWLDIDDGDGSGVDLNHNAIKDNITVEGLEGSGIEILPGSTNGKNPKPYVILRVEPDGATTFNGNIKLTVQDKATNIGSCSTRLKIDNERPRVYKIEYELSGVKVDSDGSEKKANKNDKITVRIYFADNGGSEIKEAFVRPNDMMNAVKLKHEGDEGTGNAKLNVYSATFDLTEADEWLGDNQLFSIKDGIDATDIAGNKLYISSGEEAGDTISGYLISKIRYYAPLRLHDMDIFLYKQSGDELINAPQMYVKEGEKVVLKFKTKHPIDFESHDISIGDKNEEFKKEVKEIGNEKNKLYEYTLSYDVDKMYAYDNKTFSVDVNIVDEAGYKVTIDDELVEDKATYYAPLKDSISELTFTASDSSKKAARNGDILKIRFKANHHVNVNNETARIAGRKVEFKEWEGFVYSAELKVEDGMLPDNSDISYYFEVNDDAGNEVFRADQSKTPIIKYYAPIKVHDINMSSNNDTASHTGAKNGDSLTVTFVTDHPTEIKEATVGGQGVGFTSSDRMNWSGTVNATEGMTSDMGYIPLKLVVGDEAGNDDVKKNEQDLTSQKVRYVAPISITGLTVESTNKKEPKRAVKSGDTVKITFSTNHDVSISNATIGGKNANISMVSSEGEKRKYEISYTFKDKELSDQEEIHFSFNANDMAGNTPAVISDATHGGSNLKFYAPITSEVTIASNGRNTEYVKNGGTVRITGEANHPVTPEKCKINGFEAESMGGSSSKYTISYDIPATAKTMSEEEVKFSYVLTDMAGNELEVKEVTDKSKVIYDRTQPSIEVEYDKVNFTNSSVTYEFTFTDTNLSMEDISIKVNGEEQITDEEREENTGKTFSKTIVVDSDDNYTVTASATDFAGNEADPVELKMTVDKTAPKLKTVSIATNKPEMFKDAFNIKDHLDIEEANLKEIICTVTNSNGTEDWDINEPVTTEGKNTIYIMATDMANNTSEAITYDIYIDTTPPKPVVAEKRNNVFLYTEKQSSFKDQADFEISLEPLHIEGINKPDHFTKLCITDKDGKVIFDLLEGGYESKENPGTYAISITDKGEYIILIEAEDEVGNKTGEIKYSFKIKNSILPSPDNKLATAAVATCGGVIAIATGYVLIFRRVRRKKLG